ncbi:MAG: ArnT family glycosyltransferase [Phycisphaerae bacterium]
MDHPTRSYGSLIALGANAVLYGLLSVVGIGWGLPSRSIDPYLFAGGEVWSGEKIYRLAGASERFSANRGADVDVDPLAEPLGEERGDPLEEEHNAAIPLTATDEDVAKILLRYRLYTYQPDEMITMMALSGMRPSKLQLDPRLYQYGGSFIYPVGGLIKLCGMLGLIEVRGDVVYYLDHPDEFGKFYIVARAYSALWGLLGMGVVFLIARRSGGATAGVIAALLFSLMPVVVCMAHEGKPHLPGAVLMLLAVYFAMRHLDFRAAGSSSRDADSSSRAAGFSPRGRPAKEGRAFWCMCLACGASLGMVLSSLPIFILIPMTAWMETQRRVEIAAGQDPARPRLPFGQFFSRTAIGVLLATAVYLVTNPYVLINAFVNRDVLRSNFGNSLAMYDVARVGEGLLRVLALTVEGATLPILVIGAIGIAYAIARRTPTLTPLIAPALVLFVQFVLIGAGKPAEYGRFGIFTNSALAIATATFLVSDRKGLRGRLGQGAAVLAVLWVAFCGWAYMANFRADCTDSCSRIRARFGQPPGSDVQDGGDPWVDARRTVYVPKEPAPYCCPPLPFAQVALFRLAEGDRCAGFGGPRGLKPAARGEASAARVGAVGKRREVAKHVCIAPVDWPCPAGLSATRRDTGRATRRGVLRLPILRHLAHWIGQAGELITPISWANKPFEIRSGGPVGSR